MNSEPVSITWLRNGEILAYGSTLYLDNISEQDQGEVTCRAENSFGITEQIAYIYIRPR